MKTKNFYAVSLICLLVLATITAMTSPSADMAAATWKAQSKNLGKIPQNVPVNVEFEVKNTGKAPLVITHVKAGCSCTVAEYPKDPLMPGKSGIIKATYNAAALGAFTKSVNVTTNTEPEITVLTFSGEVVVK